MTDSSSDALERAISQAISDFSENGKHTKIFANRRRTNNQYYKTLEARGIRRSRWSRMQQHFSEWCGRRNILTLVAFSVATALALGIATSCASGLFASECHEDRYSEFRQEISQTDQRLVPFWHQPIVQKPWTNVFVVRNPLSGPFINGRVFSGFLLLAAFVLAFTRWQVGNRQSAMSEIFERKRASNLLIMQNRTDVKDLVDSAMKIREMKKGKSSQKPNTSRDGAGVSGQSATGGLDEKTVDTRSGEGRSQSEKKKVKKMVFDLKEAEELVIGFLDNPHGTKKPDFNQQMFVFMELDNLEFAFMKYEANYLAPEQMFRACEIFESRCQSALFRYYAANQGLNYYTKAFHSLIVILLVFGFAASDENEGEEDAQHIEEDMSKFAWIKQQVARFFLPARNGSKP